MNPTEHIINEDMTKATSINNLDQAKSKGTSKDSLDKAEAAANDNLDEAQGTSKEGSFSYYVSKIAAHLKNPLPALLRKLMKS